MIHAYETEDWVVTLIAIPFERYRVSVDNNYFIFSVSHVQ